MKRLALETPRSSSPSLGTSFVGAEPSTHDRLVNELKRTLATLIDLTLTFKQAHWNARMVGHPVGDAAMEQPSERAAPVGAQRNQVGGLREREVGDRRRGVVLRREDRLRRNALRPCFGAPVLEVPLRLSPPFILDRAEVGADQP